VTADVEAQYDFTKERTMIMMNTKRRFNNITARSSRGACLPTAFCLFLNIFAAASWSAENEMALILQVSAATPDVEVTLFWGEEATFPTLARLVVRDVFDTEVSSTWVGADEPGLVTESLPNALLGIAPRGTQYFVHLEDSAGMVLGVSFPYQVALECEDPESCVFVLHGGIDSPDAALVDSALADALEEAASVEGHEILAAVLVSHPELRGEVYTLGWQLAVLEGRFPTQQECTCRFAAVVKHSNSECSEYGAAHSFQVNLSSRTVARIEGCTERRGILPRLLDYYEIFGSSTLRVVPLCWNTIFSGTTEVPILGPIWQGSEELPTAELAPCEMDCVGALTYEASYSADLSVESASYIGQLTTENVAFDVGGLSLASLFPWEAKTLTVGAPYIENLGNSWSNSVALGEEATVVSVGVIDLGQGAEGHGSISTGYSITAMAQSICTGPLDATISAIGVQLPLSGLALRPPADEINILIGRVDG
jgi:hypothetical protein